MANNYLITGYWGEPHVTAENDRGINAALWGAGRYVLPTGREFYIAHIGDNTVRMYDGKLIDNGAVAGIPAGEYVDLQIANAEQGKKRYDLIVFQYSQDPATLVESGKFVVIQGEETDGTPTDPELTQEDLLSGSATFDQFPLWRIEVDGINSIVNERLYSRAATLADKAPIKLIMQNYIITTEAEFEANLAEAWEDTADSSERHIIFNILIDGLPLSGGIWHLTLCKTNDSYGVIKAISYAYAKPSILYRNKYDFWGEWEWQNPPMENGIEYATTERYSGKTVYAKLLTSLTAPDGSNATISHDLGLDSFSKIIDIRVAAKEESAGIKHCLPFSANGAVHSAYKLDGDTLTISSYNGWGYGVSTKFDVLIKYTK